MKIFLLLIIFFSHLRKLIKKIRNGNKLDIFLGRKMSRIVRINMINMLEFQIS